MIKEYLAYTRKVDIAEIYKIFDDLDPWLQHSRNGTLEEYTRTLPAPMMKSM